MLVLYTDAVHPGAWTAKDLTSTDGGLNWTGTGTTSSNDQVQYIVEAVDAAGNVAVSNNEGADFNGVPQPAISFAVAGPGPTNGFYTGPVTVTVTAPSGATYVLDGANPAAVPSNGVITVSAPGNHTITVTDPAKDVATRAFSISTTQTTTTVVPSVNPGATGQPITYTATVNAASSGGGSPSGYVEFLDGGNPILACGGASGALLNGSTAACQVTYTLPGPHQITADYLGNSSFAPSTTSSPLSETVNPGQVGGLHVPRRLDHVADAGPARHLHRHGQRPHQRCHPDGLGHVRGRVEPHHLRRRQPDAFRLGQHGNRDLPGDLHLDGRQPALDQRRLRPGLGPQLHRRGPLGRHQGDGRHGPPDGARQVPRRRARRSASRSPTRPPSPGRLAQPRRAAQLPGP